MKSILHYYKWALTTWPDKDGFDNSTNRYLNGTAWIDFPSLPVFNYMVPWMIVFFVLFVYDHIPNWIGKGFLVLGMFVGFFASIRVAFKYTGDWLDENYHVEIKNKDTGEVVYSNSKSRLGM